MVFGAHLINICLCDHLIIMVQRGAHIYLYNILFCIWGLGIDI